jgi:putative transposase
VVNTIIPQAHVQLCIAHMVQNSTKHVPWKDYKAVASDFKPIYQSVIEEEALLKFDNFCSHWDNK